MIDKASLNPSRKDLRSFGLIFGFGFAALFGLSFPWLAARAYPLWPWVLAGVSIGLGLLLPVALKPAYVLWMMLGGVLGWINTRIILVLVFYLVFMPIGLLMRVTGRDAMARRFDAQAVTYRTESKGAEAKQLEKPF